MPRMGRNPRAAPCRLALLAALATLCIATAAASATRAAESAAAAPSEQPLSAASFRVGVAHRTEALRQDAAAFAAFLADAGLDGAPFAVTLTTSKPEARWRLFLNFLKMAQAAAMPLAVVVTDTHALGARPPPASPPACALRPPARRPGPLQSAAPPRARHASCRRAPWRAWTWPATRLATSTAPPSGCGWWRPPSRWRSTWRRRATSRSFSWRPISPCCATCCRRCCACAPPSS